MFTKAVKTERKLRMAITGPSGSGKTYTALAIAQALGNRIALIDTEHGGSTLYADEFDFDYVSLDSFSPDTYITYLHAAAKEQYPVVVVDTISHAWMGKDGTLEIVDKQAARNNRSDNRFTAWQVGTKKQTEFVEALLSVPFHLIVTMRSKMDYLMEKDGNTTKVTKIGMAPVQREGIEYEFDVIGDMDLHHTMTITKSRLRSLTDLVVGTPGLAFGRQILGALDEGSVPDPRIFLTKVGQLLRQYVEPLGHTGLRNALLYQAFRVDTPQQVKQLAVEDIKQGLPMFTVLCMQLPKTWEESLHPQEWIQHQLQQLPAAPAGIDAVTGEALPPITAYTDPVTGEQNPPMPDEFVTRQEKERRELQEQEEAEALAKAGQD